MFRSTIRSASLSPSFPGRDDPGYSLYIPPEQIENTKNLDKRVDIYSWGGVMLYEILIGKTPFPGTFTAETIALIHKGRYTPPRRINPKIAPVLRAFVRKSMKVRRKRRYQGLKSIIRILEKRIKHRDPASIKRAVKKIIQGKDIRNIYKRKRSWLRGLFTGLILLGALPAGGYTLYRQGYYYEYFKPRNYGALILSSPDHRPSDPPVCPCLRSFLLHLQTEV